jgi:hypothetical protein
VIHRFLVQVTIQPDNEGVTEETTRQRLESELSHSTASAAIADGVRGTVHMELAEPEDGEL